MSMNNAHPGSLINWEGWWGRGSEVKLEPINWYESDDDVMNRDL